MQHSQKMAIIPHELLNNLQEQSKINLLASNSVARKTVGLDDEIQRILTRNDLSDEAKANLYTQALQKFRMFYRQSGYSQSPDNQDKILINKSAEFKDKMKDDVVRTVAEQIEKVIPKNAQRRGQGLLSILKSSDGFDINDKGEMIIDGQLFPKSNIIDLISKAAAPESRYGSSSSRHDSEGSYHFNKFLNSINIPRQVIGSERTWEKIVRPSIERTKPDFYTPRSVSQKRRQSRSPVQLRTSTPKVVSITPTSRKSKRSKSGVPGIRLGSWINYGASKKK